MKKDKQFEPELLKFKNNKAFFGKELVLCKMIDKINV